MFRLNANRDRPFCNLTPTSEDRLFIATIGEIYEATGTAVFDGRTYKQRYRRFELSGGRLLLMAPVGICRCDITALRDVYMKREGDQVHPLDSFAPFLYDPKRFFAAAEGIAVRRPHLPTPPELTVVSPKGRVVSVKDDGPAIEVHASGEGGILGFQIEKDGKVLPFESVGHVEHEPDGSATLAWTIDRPHSPQTNLRIRAIGRNGVLSLPALITLDWQ